MFFDELNQRVIEDMPLGDIVSERFIRHIISLNCRDFKTLGDAKLFFALLKNAVIDYAVAVENLE